LICDQDTDLKSGFGSLEICRTLRPKFAACDEPHKAQTSIVKSDHTALAAYVQHSAKVAQKIGSKGKI
jgi:hypothetical protein